MRKWFPSFMNLVARGGRLLGFGTGAMVLRFDPLTFFRELASMLRSGVTLPEALTFAADDFPVTARRRLDAVREQVEQGLPLSVAVQQLPEAWAPKVLRATIRAGERSGRLPDLLEELTREQEKLGALNRRVRGAMVYPLVVLVIAGLLLVPVMSSLPPLISTFAQAGAAPPWPVVLLSKIYPLLEVLTLLLAFSLVALVISIYRPAGPGTLAVLARKLTSKLPIIRGLHRALLEVRFARTLRVLLEAEVALDEALEMCREVVADHRAGGDLVAGAQAIREGIKPSTALRGLRFLSPAFLWFMTGSERRGDFVEVVSAMAETAEERFLTRLETAEQLLEPAGTVVIGAIVGSLVIAIYHGIYSLIWAVGS
jgi:general secretion pathway protein F